MSKLRTLAHRLGTLLVVLSLVTTLFATPVMAATGGAGPSWTASAATGSSLLNPLSYQVPEDTQQYQVGGSLQPSWLVRYENDSYASLASWANESDSRTIISTDNATNRAVVAASPSAMGMEWLDRNVFGNGLAHRGYIERIDRNVVVERTDPVTNLRSEDAWSSPHWRGDFTSTGIAFSEDMNESTLADARVALDVDDVATSVNGSGVRVAVIDTGLNVQNKTSDPLYQDRVVAGKNFVTGETGVLNVSTDTDHGPWVAASIAADPNTSTRNETYEGVAPDAELVIAKALSDDGSGSTAQIVDAIYWSERQDADIVSMSLGAQTYNAEMATAMKDALEGNVTAFYVATGNSRLSQPVAIASPADVDALGVLSIGATNTTNASMAGPAYFSQAGPDDGVRDLSGGKTRGAVPDLGAPGTSIEAPLYDTFGTRTNVSLSGTSMATPIAAGVGALAMDANPTFENNTEAFVGYAKNTSKRVPGAGVTEVGAGHPNAKRFVNLNATERTQEEARDDGSKSRDSANRGLVADPSWQPLAKVRSAVF